MNKLTQQIIDSKYRGDDEQMFTITLCGSTRFKNYFEQVNLWLTLRCCRVYSVSSFPQSEGMEFTPEQKQMLDRVHKAKIHHSDAIFVIDVEGYIGESTESEIEFAKSLGCYVFYLSQHLDELNQWLSEINKQITPKFTQAALEQMAAGAIFGYGNAIIDGVNVAWVAKRGDGFPDWAIYFEHTASVSGLLTGRQLWIAQNGLKVKDKRIIRELVSGGDEEFYNAYRY